MCIHVYRIYFRFGYLRHFESNLFSICVSVIHIVTAIDYVKHFYSHETPFFELSYIHRKDPKRQKYFKIPTD